MADNKPEIMAEFDRCPVCGSTRRFAEEVAKEQVEKGAMEPGLKYGLQQVGGPILDPRKASQMLVGARVPAVFALLDVCLGFPDKPCGCVYAVRLERGEAALQGIQRQSPGFMPPRR